MNGIVNFFGVNSFAKNKQSCKNVNSQPHNSLNFKSKMLSDDSDEYVHIPLDFGDDEDNKSKIHKVLEKFKKTENSVSKIKEKTSNFGNSITAGISEASGHENTEKNSEKISLRGNMTKEMGSSNAKNSITTKNNRSQNSSDIKNAECEASQREEEINDQAFLDTIILQEKEQVHTSNINNYYESEERDIPYHEEDDSSVQDDIDDNGWDDI